MSQNLRNQLLKHNAIRDRPEQMDLICIRSLKNQDDSCMIYISMQFTVIKELQNSIIDILLHYIQSLLKKQRIPPINTQGFCDINFLQSKINLLCGDIYYQLISCYTRKNAP